MQENCYEIRCVCVRAHACVGGGVVGRFQDSELDQLVTRESHLMRWEII